MSVKTHAGLSKTNTRKTNLKKCVDDDNTAVQLINDMCVFLRIMLRQWEETCSIVNQLFSSGDQMLLVDFDSHLDDITKDWTNQKLNAKIMELISPANGNV